MFNLCRTLFRSSTRTLWVLWVSGLACAGPPSRTESTALVASGADLQSINPLITVHPMARQVQKHVLFLTLARYDRNLEPRPRLASWRWEDDRRTLYFALRRDVRWHDGRPTWAGDVLWTLRMAQAPGMAYPRARELGSIVGIEPVDSFTVVVTFDGAQPRFPDVLTDLAILPEHHFRGASPSAVRRHAFNRNPVGNGPFEFVEYRPNQRWVFRRSASFPTALEPARLERLVIVVVDEPTTKLAGLSSGELDLAGISPAHADFVRGDPRLDVLDYPVQFAVGLIWNQRRAPFDDRRVRQALTMAIDRQLLVDAYLYGFGMVADGPVSPDHPWVEPTGVIGYDPAAAVDTLEAAGWVRDGDGRFYRDGEPVTIELVTVGSGDNALEQMVQAQLGAVGVTVRIRQLELAAFLEAAQGDRRDFDVLMTGIPGDLALGHVAALFGSRPAGPLAYAGYDGAAFEQALAAVRAASTDTALEMAWRAAQRALATDHPSTWLYHARGVQGVSRAIDGITIDLRGELRGVTRWERKPGSP